MDVIFVESLDILSVTAPRSLQRTKILVVISFLRNFSLRLEFICFSILFVVAE